VEADKSGAMGVTGALSAALAMRAGALQGVEGASGSGNRRQSGADSRKIKQAACRRRRRALVAVLFFALLTAGLAVNLGPLTDYLDARARLEKASQQVAALEQQRLELQAELGKLTEASYLENLARKELSYARPGEELYIVIDSSSLSDSGATLSAGAKVREAYSGPGQAATGTFAGETENTEPGFFERLALALIGFFGGSVGE